MRALLLALVLLPAMSQAISLQRPNRQCELTIDDAPEIRGLRLRQTKKQVQALYPMLNLEGGYKPDTVPISQGKYGESFIVLLSDRYEFTEPTMWERLKGVRRVELRFLDGRISLLSFEYDDSVKWEGVDDFTHKVGELLKLPVAWQEHGPRSSERNMECRGFTVTTSANGLFGPSITFTDDAVPKVIRQRKEEEERKAKETFKP